MDVIKTARELGKAIQQDERFIRYAKAKLANDSDTDLQNAIGKFNITRMELEKASSDETPNEENIKTLNEELLKKIKASKMEKKEQRRVAIPFVKNKISLRE